MRVRTCRTETYSQLRTHNSVLNNSTCQNLDENFFFLSTFTVTVAASSRVTCLRPERQGELGFACQLFTHEALSFHLRDAEPFIHFRQVNAHHELVARDDGPAELDAVDAC